MTGGITESPRPKPGLYTLHTEGGIVAAAGQPSGEAAIGAVLKNADNLLVEAISEPIGIVDDHHVAEFRALVEGLTMAKRHGVDKIRVFTDSELLVKSVLDDVNLKSEELQELRSPARDLYDLESVLTEEVARELCTALPSELRRAWTKPLDFKDPVRTVAKCLGVLYLLLE